MGDWYLDRNGEWQYDRNAPSPSPDVTRIGPAVPREEPPARDGFVREDGSAYERVSPGWFDSYDQVDSRTVVDRGGPPDAA